MRIVFSGKCPCISSYIGPIIADQLIIQVLVFKGKGNSLVPFAMKENNNMGSNNNNNNNGHGWNSDKLTKEQESSCIRLYIREMT